ncbi:MAG: carbonic anhydrase, partial [Gallionella sp.]
MTTPRQLIQGFARFRGAHFSAQDVMYRNLVEQGQTPKFLIVGCCDSRVDPALIFDCAPGDLFVIRNVANLVPPVEGRAGHHGTTAALEYGVRNLGVEHIIVLGHAHCGGIQTLMKTGGASDPDSFIDDWMKLAEGARASVIQDFTDADDEQRQHACEQRAILVSLQNLHTFSWIAQRVELGTLTLHGWYFDIE